MAKAKSGASRQQPASTSMSTMVVYSTPLESPTRRRREVDSLSLDSDLDSIKLAMTAVFEAAVELDHLLEEQNDPEVGQNDEDDSSFASEERRIHESEEELRRALDSIEQDSSDETDTVDAPPSFEPLDAFSAESYESPESQVPLLQPVSPFGSPFSESSTPAKGESTCLRIDTSPASYESPIIATTHSSPKAESPKKRQIRAYGLRPHVVVQHDSFVDLEAQLSSPKGGAARIMANALYGKTEYTVRPLFGENDKKFRRSIQGTMSVVLATGIVVADRARESPLHLVWILVLPVLVAMIQAKLPHTRDETLLAAIILGTHVTMSHLQTLPAM